MNVSKSIILIGLIVTILGCNNNSTSRFRYSAPMSKGMINSFLKETQVNQENITITIIGILTL
jgi:uncharacterized lipoprotein NlpE involved in copper resistance